MKVGIIGTGFGGRVVAGAFEASGCQVTDVVTARDHDAVRALCHSGVDLVSVHSPPFLHRDHVGMALEAGRAVLCDKPFGRSLEEAEAMAGQADEAGVVNLVNFEFRHQPARRTMHELVSSGAIGHPEHLAYTAFTSGSRVPLRPWGWLFDRSLGGGWIGAFGSHAVDLVRWLLGEVSSAGAATWITVTARPDGAGELVRCDAEDAFTGWADPRVGGHRHGGHVVHRRGDHAGPHRGHRFRRRHRERGRRAGGATPVGREVPALRVRPAGGRRPPPRPWGLGRGDPRRRDRGQPGLAVVRRRCGLHAGDGAVAGPSARAGG